MSLTCPLCPGSQSTRPRFTDKLDLNAHMAIRHGWSLARYGDGPTPIQARVLQEEAPWHTRRSTAGATSP